MASALKPSVFHFLPCKIVRTFFCEKKTIFFSLSVEILRCVSPESMLELYLDMVSVFGTGKTEMEKETRIRRNALEQIS